jgi:pimeloyl-ACP methyl ester carboxylesterase
MERIELSGGPIEYADTGGDGPVVVMIHGLVMDGEIWRDVVAELARDHRCIRPTLPLGAHSEPMRRDADLSLRGMGRIIHELIERMDLHEATLCFNDWSCGQTMIADGLLERVGRLAFVSCEAYENYPPGLPGWMVWLSARLPGGMAIMRQTLVQPWLRRLPIVYGRLSKRGVPDAMLDTWLARFARPEIQRDLRKYAGDAMTGRRHMLAATPALGTFEKPVLIAWGTEDRLMPIRYGRRLANDLPNSRFVEVADSYTLVPWDQPVALADAIRGFTRHSSSPPTTRGSADRH